MKYARVVHNPGAGVGDISKNELVALINSAGFGCSYSSTKKKGWEKIEASETDFLILAGGDGTVRKVAGQLLDKTLLERRLPIGLLPMGTANNIARTLGIKGTHHEIIQSWSETHIKKFDVGRLYGLPESFFFLESFGYGIFPRLMVEMKKQSDDLKDTPEKSLRLALSILHELVEHLEPRYCRVLIDGVEHDGNYLLVEVMNTSSIGPNLKLAPLADPGDGVFEIVLIDESQRHEFAEYIQNKLKDREKPFGFTTLKAKHLEIFWDGEDAHVDDQYVQLKKNTDVRIELLHGLLEFFVSAPILASV